MAATRARLLTVPWSVAKIQFGSVLQLTTISKFKFCQMEKSVPAGQLSPMNTYYWPIMNLIYNVFYMYVYLFSFCNKIDKWISFMFMCYDL